MLLRKRVGPAEDPGKHVFISYSRRDLAAVEQLKDGLADREVNAWIDRSEIPGSAPWRAEVADGIRRSDVFLFVVTPQSAASRHCLEELDLAVEYGKRIVPLIHEDPETDLPEALAEPNWTYGGDIDELVRVLRLDLPWVHRHTLLLVQAYEWSVNGRRRSALLRGKDLRTARQWLAASRTDVESRPTDLQREYLAKGRVAARQRWGLGTVVTAVLVTAALIVGFSQVETAHQNRSRELATRSEDALKDGLDLGLLLGREALAERPTVEARRALLTALRTQPRQVGFFDALAGVPAGQRATAPRHLPLAVQPNGHLLAIPVSTGIRFITLPTGQPAWTVKTLSATPSFSPDGRWLAVATSSDPRRLELIDVAARQVVERLTVPQLHGLPDDGFWFLGSSSPGAFSADSAKVAVPANDSTVRIRNLKERTWSKPFVGHNAIHNNGRFVLPNLIKAVALSPDGRLLASGDWRGDVVIWDVPTGRHLTTVNTKPSEDRRSGGVESLAFDPMGDYLAVGTAHQTVAVWRTEGWSREIDLLPGGGNDPVQALAFSPDGRILVAAGHSTGPRLHEVGSWDRIGDPLSNDHLSGTSAVFLDRGTSMLWGVQGTGRLAVWKVRGPGPLGEVVRGSPGDAVALAVSRRSAGPVAVGGLDGTISLSGLTLRHKLSSQAWEVYLRSVALSEDERTLFSAGDDGSVSVWDVSSGTRRTRWSLESTATAIAFDRHGRLIAAAHRNGPLVVHRVTDHKLLLKVSDSIESADVLTFSPDGSMLAAGGSWGTVLVDISEGRVLGALDRPDEYVASAQALAFSPDGKTLAIGSEDGTYSLWDVHDRRLTDERSAHIGEVLSAEFTPDGRMLALGGEEGRVLLVDVASRRALGPALTADTAPVECAESPCQPVGDLVFTSDGKHLLSATNAAQHIYNDTTPQVTIVPSSVRQPGATRWSTHLPTWIQAACTRAARPLTPAEQDRYDISHPVPCTP